MNYKYLSCEERYTISILRSKGEAYSHETIYLRTYNDSKSNGELHKHLRHRVKSFKNRSLKNDIRGQIANQTSIDLRPQEVEQRLGVGHWEVDSIIGKPSGNVLVTMVERFSESLTEDHENASTEKHQTPSSLTTN